MFRRSAEAIAGTLAVGNHWTVANTISTGTTTTRGTGHAGMAKGIIVRFWFVLLLIFSRDYRLLFCWLATFQVIGTNQVKPFIELLDQLGLFRRG